MEHFFKKAKSLFLKLKTIYNMSMLEHSCGGSGSNPVNPQNVKIITPLELHVCMGLNCCKGHDRFGTNNCAGQGDCATVAHSCHTMNECRSQGGCGLFGSAEEQEHPGENDCAWRGSCASPIEAERLHIEGKEGVKGQSVWLHARKLFEARMDIAGREIGKPRFENGPPSWWLNQQGGFDACGESGPRACSFGKDTLCKEKVLCGSSAPEKTDK